VEPVDRDREFCCHRDGEIVVGIFDHGAPDEAFWDRLF
jgi:hypothetical protein